MNTQKRHKTFKLNKTELRLSNTKSKITENALGETPLVNTQNAKETIDLKINQKHLGKKLHILNQKHL